MTMGWDSDFSYSYFKKMLRVAKDRFELHTLSEAPKIIGKNGKPKLILRHDVDVSLKRALEMAKIEKDFAIRATYMVMANSRLYRLREKDSCVMLQEIINMGHEIAVHFSPPRKRTVTLETKIDSACKKVEKIIRLQVLSVSFHRPPQDYLFGKLMIGTRVNAYSKELMEWYRSDSKGRWICGEPLPQLSTLKIPLLQLLIHPIWWGEKHASKEERLRAFVAEENRGKPLEDAEALRKKIIVAIRVKFDL